MFSLADGPLLSGAQSEIIDTGEGVLFGSPGFGALTFANKTNMTLVARGATAPLSLPTQVFVDNTVAATGLSQVTDELLAGGRNSVTIDATPAGVTTLVAKEGVSDTFINVGNEMDRSGVQEIRGAIEVDDPFGGATLNVDDSDNFNRTTPFLNQFGITGLARPVSVGKMMATLRSSRPLP